jgi:hypothetical protein
METTWSKKTATSLQKTTKPSRPEGVRDSGAVMRQPISLEQIRIDSPCEMPWEAMHGDDRSRFCEKCHLHVHNLSAMTSDAAAKLVGERTDRVCVAYVPTARGSPITLDYAKRRQRFTWHGTVIIGMLGAALVGLVQMLVGVPRPGTRVTAGVIRAPAGPTLVKGGIPAPPAVAPNACGDAGDCVDQ